MTMITADRPVVMRRHGPWAEELVDTPGRVEWVWGYVALDPTRRYPWPRDMSWLNPYQRDELAALASEAGVEPAALLPRLYREQPSFLREATDAEYRLKRGVAPPFVPVTPPTS